MLPDLPCNSITSDIIASAIEVHRTLGPGLLESSYMPCLKMELASRHRRFVTERKVPIVYKGLTLSEHYRIDLLVEDTVVVEVKAVERLLPVHQAQALTYMALLNCPAGLLMNFNVARLLDGVKRLFLPSHMEQPRSNT